MKNSLIFLLLMLLLLLTPPFAFSQNNSSYEPEYDVHVNYPAISIAKANLRNAQTLIDLDKNYKTSWVKEYRSVEVSTTYKGKVRKAESRNDTLSQEQKNHMNMADLGTDISVVIRYIPDNNLKHNDVKEHDFTFTVEPENNAKYPGGEQELKKYLKENLFEKISAKDCKQYKLAAAIFTIDEEGRIADPHLFWTSEDEKTDKLLLETICNMPKWTPAAYSDGTKIKQEFALTLGDPMSCVVNMLNIKNSKYRRIPD